jgi:hypothetical protein
MQHAAEHHVSCRTCQTGCPQKHGSGSLVTQTAAHHQQHMTAALLLQALT